MIVISSINLKKIDDDDLKQALFTDEPSFEVKVVVNPHNFRIWETPQLSELIIQICFPVLRK